MRAAPVAGLDQQFGVGAHERRGAGKGNNAGDAFVVGRHLLCADHKVRVFHLETESGYKGATLKNFRILKALRAKLVHLENSAELQAFFSSGAGPHSIIDGILGTGLTRDLEGIFYEVVEAINEHVQAQDVAEVISLDIPSGVSGDTGAIHGTSIQASLTISFGYPKLGHFLPPGAGRRGELVNVDISLPPRFLREGDKFLLGKAPMGALLKERDRYGHKNSFGHTLLIGGSPGRLGAITMSARACHKMGTGLVTAATWDDGFNTLSSSCRRKRWPCRSAFPGRNTRPTSASCPATRASSSAPVSGSGPSEAVDRGDPRPLRGPDRARCRRAQRDGRPRLHPALAARRAPTVLTPHVGEMARLIGMPKGETSSATPRPRSRRRSRRRTRSCCSRARRR